MRAARFGPICDDPLDGGARGSAHSQPAHVVVQRRRLWTTPRAFTIEQQDKLNNHEKQASFYRSSLSSLKSWVPGGRSTTWVGLRREDGATLGEATRMCCTDARGGVWTAVRGATTREQRACPRNRENHDLRMKDNTLSRLIHQEDFGIGFAVRDSRDAAAGGRRRPPRR